MKNAKKAAPHGAAAPGRRSASAPKERLIAVKPSGQKDESLSGLIHDLVRQIPPGRVTSYGAIAAVLSLPNPRMVGRAMRTAGKDVPAQRVVNSAGRLTGEHTQPRKLLLEKEGVTVKGDKVVNFKVVFWDPCKEL
ncbi:MGMT family protein [Dinghuibacter silviterrae]|uniref:Methylated-DNA-protein-cysteine methyltransferase-like protein n=1 Tax=Dinghuibacter silviterrae TaxID=1539049 RepID=A0A4R8DIC0_9BACT|nr:MGMT family protein [Dinghuibacter silviterrae]TDW96720.1 methylated-DNA-protein-cysteine methyltransferase-like protein [Dinghuibacter silviterrae]